MGYFDVASDPLSQAGERASLCLFLRGDLRPAQHKVTLVMTEADLAKPAASAQGAAAKIKAEEAQAKAKIAAVEYLASVDCRYYEEAELALINSLRREKNETPMEFAVATGISDVLRITRAYNRVRFGSQALSSTEVAEIEQCLTRLEKDERRVRNT